MVYLLQNEISVSTHDFQHIIKNCETQSSLSRVGENKSYCDQGVFIKEGCRMYFSSGTRLEASLQLFAAMLRSMPPSLCDEKVTLALMVSP